MSDDSIRDEIEANNARKDAGDEREGGIPGLVDNALSPVTDAIGRAGSDVDEDDVEDQAAANDADQRA